MSILIVLFASGLLLTQGDELLVLSDADSAVMDSCVELAGVEATHRCLGRMADSCLQESSEDGPAAELLCATLEQQYWDERLNLAYTQLAASLDRSGADSRRMKLREAQRAWINFRDGECAQRAQAAQGLPARVVGARCHLQLTAGRALEIEQQVAG